MPWQNTPQTRHKSSTTYNAEWRKARLAALKRDGHRCVQCGSTTRLQVDHINGTAAGHVIGNLRTLCEGCHRKVTAQQGKGYRRPKTEPPDPQPRPATQW